MRSKVLPGRFHSLGSRNQHVPDALCDLTLVESNFWLLSGAFGRRAHDGRMVYPSLMFKFCSEHHEMHCMIGHVQEWLHEYLVGIRPDPNAPGFKHFLLEPNPVGNLTWAKGHHDGPYGRISLHWRRQEGRLLVDPPPPCVRRPRIPRPSWNRITC